MKNYSYHVESYKKVKLHYKLPVTFNDYTPIPPEKFVEIKNFFVDKYGGLSIESPSEGYWQENGFVFKDTNLEYSIFIPKSDFDKKVKKDISKHISIQKRFSTASNSLLLSSHVHIESWEIQTGELTKWNFCITLNLRNHNWRNVYKILIKHGFYVDRQRGDHIQMAHPDGRFVTLVRQNPIKVGTEKYFNPSRHITRRIFRWGLDHIMDEQI